MNRFTAKVSSQLAGKRVLFLFKLQEELAGLSLHGIPRHILEHDIHTPVPGTSTFSFAVVIFGLEELPDRMAELAVARMTCRRVFMSSSTS